MNNKIDEIVEKARNNNWEVIAYNSIEYAFKKNNQIIRYISFDLSEILEYQNDKYKIICLQNGGTVDIYFEKLHIVTYSFNINIKEILLDLIEDKVIRVACEY